VDVRQRLQELGIARMPEPRPLASEGGVHLEARCLDHRLSLVGVDRAYRIDDRATGADALRSRTQERELQLGQGHGAPAEIGPAVEDAEARARGVDERAVEPSEVRRELTAVGDDDPDVSRADPLDGRRELTRPPLIDLDRDDVSRKHGGLPTWSRAEVERPFALARTDREPDEL
jgi:hypothetical protein